MVLADKVNLRLPFTLFLYLAIFLLLYVVIRWTAGLRIIQLAKLAPRRRQIYATTLHIHVDAVDLPKLGCTEIAVLLAGLRVLDFSHCRVRLRELIFDFLHN